jgi:hypothetical protein
VRPKETRDGWPLLSVETEVNGDSKSSNEKFLVRFIGLVLPVQENFVLFWLL